MNDNMKRYWENKLLESLEQDYRFRPKTPYHVTWRQRLHNRYLNVVDKIYELLTGRDPNEE